jgi:hypothetical protein
MREISKPSSYAYVSIERKNGGSNQGRNKNDIEEDEKMKTKHIGALLIVELAFLIAFGIIVWHSQTPTNETMNKVHLPLYEKIVAIKNRLTINITEANFTNPVRLCDFYELREEDSEDYFQTTVNFWVFQHGQETHGDIEAYVEIYNLPDRTDVFIVEVARSCWYELTVSLDNVPVVVFPTVTSNTLSRGYITFEVAT